MNWITRSEVRRMTAVAAMAAMLAPAPVLAQQATAAAPSAAAQPLAQQRTAGEKLTVFRSKSELVLVSVTARDKSGKLVRDLKQSDFTVLEDGKPQTVRSFDIEDAENLAPEAPAQAGAQQAEVAAGKQLLTAGSANRQALRDHRLIVLFFDLSAMQDDEVERATESAENFVEKKMDAADLVAVISFENSLAVLQDFTSDRKLLGKALLRLNGDSTGFENGSTGSDDGAAEAGQNFTADDSEYNTFNTDRRLQALAAISDALSRVDQKKSVLYFSGGMTQTGTDNQAQLRAAVNAAVRANVALYPVDSRGLQALPPGGDATTASIRGQGAYSGAAMQSQMDSNFSSQETLVTMAEDTGGRAFLDSNDFAPAFARVQSDMTRYYVLGYRSTNPSMDGRFRRINVKINRPGIKLEFRRGYYGPRDFRHYTQEDREQQLADEMSSEMPATDLPVYLGASFFRLKEDRYYVPVSLVVPGSAIPFAQAGSSDKATLDVLGLVREKETHLPVGTLRETVKLDLDASQQASRRNVQYNTGFLLPPGSFHLKFVLRENTNGQMGSFETDIAVPDLKKQAKRLKLSSVVLSSQKIAVESKMQKKSQSPLIVGGEEIVPNISHVFTTGQTLRFYYEVYDPAAKGSEEKTAAVRLLTSIAFFKGRVKVYETPLVLARTESAAERHAAAFQLEVPAGKLQPGWYTAQINVIDDAKGNFAFPRLPILVKAAAPAATAPAAAPASPAYPAETPAPAPPPSAPAPQSSTPALPTPAVTNAAAPASKP